MKILAISDPHYHGKPSSWTILFDKRVVGLFNYHYLRKHQHTQEYLQFAVDYILENPPDIVLCTGDVTTDGEVSEFEYIIKILKPLVNDKRFDFFYVPGNHDYYVKDKKCVGALKNAVEVLNKNRFTLESMPYIFEKENIEFCFVNESYPVHMLMSHGILKKKDADFVVNWIKNENGKKKVLVGHYPLFEKENMLVRWRHKLYGHKEIMELHRQGKLDLAICGHIHKPIPAINERGRGEVIVGSVTKNGSLAEIDYNDEKDIFTYHRIDLKKIIK